MIDPGNEDKTTPVARFEYPDEAGYPDGTGTLDEGTRDEAPANAPEPDEAGENDEGPDADVAEVAAEIEHFADEDTEDA